MSTESKTEVSSPSPQEVKFHLVCGSGGVRAILGSTGAVLGCHFAGISKWSTAGGASGGSIPTSLLAGGVEPVRLAHLAIETDFATLIDRHGSICKVILAYWLKSNVYWLVRPRFGLYGSKKMGEFIEGLVGRWPDNYWTVATAGTSQILFAANGVYEYPLEGERKRLPEGLPTPGYAVRASSAIPAIFDAIKFAGRYLHDGALTVDGRTPINAVKRHFGARPENIVAVDVGLDPVENTWLVRLLRKFYWRLVCGRHCPVEGKTPTGASGTILIQPDVTSVGSLEFSPSPDEKFEALMAGFTAALPPLEKAGLLTGAKAEQGRLISREFAEIKRSARRPGELAERTAALLAAHGLY
jgi:predicted acylesterase/phospholipase RssA